MDVAMVSSILAGAAVCVFLATLVIPNSKKKQEDK